MCKTVYQVFIVTLIHPHIPLKSEVVPPQRSQEQHHPHFEYVIDPVGSFVFPRCGQSFWYVDDPDLNVNVSVVSADAHADDVASDEVLFEHLNVVA